MSDLEALLAGIVANPHEGLRWLVLADWLDDHGQPERAELLRLHRELLRTSVEPEAHPERTAIHTRIVELIDRGVYPCVPSRTLILPSGVPLLVNFIPPGSFLMGSEDESPIHKVTLTKGFYIGVAPVTQEHWVSVMGDNPSVYRDDSLPVDSASWVDAMEFCEKVTNLSGQTVRLPTEAEWEYACRAGTTTHFHWGDVPDTERMNYNGSYTWNGSKEGKDRSRPTASGTFAPNPWGLWDFHGNLWEWCIEWYDRRFYERSPELDPRCEEGEQSYRVLRGGEWSFHPQACAATFRYAVLPSNHYESHSFRVVVCLE